jgi:hypothetical protein
VGVKHYPVYENIGNSNSPLVGERIKGRELAEVVFCIEDTFEVVVWVIMLVNEVILNLLKCCAALNWL